MVVVGKILNIREKNQKDSGRLETKTTEMKKYFCSTVYQIWASQVMLVVKNPPANAGDARDAGSVPGSGRPLEKEMAAHSSFLA